MGNHSLRKQTYPYQRSWGFPVRDLCCLQPWQVERLILLFPPVLSSPLLCQSLPVFSFFDSFSCLSVSSFFLLPSFFPLLCSLSLSVRLPFFFQGRRSSEALRTGSRLWQSSCLWKRKTTVTFPAFLLEISNRSGLSVQDRDPGGGKGGCLRNRFLSHHFLYVD